MARDEDDPLSPGERAFFTSRGEKPIPADAPKPEKVTESQVPASEDTAAAADKDPPVQDLKEREPPHVPYEALKDERTKRQQTEERLRQSELQQARMEERFKMLLDTSRAAPPVTPKPPPRVDEDIFGAVEHLGKELDRRGQEIDGYKQRLANEEKNKQMREWAESHEAHFAKDNPDYYKAIHFMRLGRSMELNALGVQPGQQMKDQLEREEFDLMRRAATLKKSPARMAFEIAKARGFTKDMQLPGWNDRSHEAPQADAGAQLDRVEAGQRQSGSMSDIGGASKPTADLKLSDLGKMSEKEFSMWLNKNGEKYQRMKRAGH
jgi:hypothetical protein